MEGVKHHLLDIMEPNETMSAGLFHKLAKEKIEDILSRNKVPIVVGGSVFYLKWLLFGAQGGDTSNTTAAKHLQEKLESLNNWDKR